MTRRLGQVHLARASTAGVVIAFVLVLALLLAACGEESSTSSSPSATASASGSATGTWSQADLAAIEADPALKDMLPSGMTEIRVASDIPYPPWEYYVEGTKEPTGFDFDLSQAIGAKIGVPAPFNESAVRRHHPVPQIAARTT